MKVIELINKLKKLDQNKEIVFTLKSFEDGDNTICKSELTFNWLLENSEEYIDMEFIE